MSHGCPFRNELFIWKRIRVIQHCKYDFIVHLTSRWDNWWKKWIKLPKNDTFLWEISLILYFMKFDPYKTIIFLQKYWNSEYFSSRSILYSAQKRYFIQKCAHFERMVKLTFKGSLNGSINVFLNIITKLFSMNFRRKNIFLEYFSTISYHFGAKNEFVLKVSFNSPYFVVEKNLLIWHYFS